MFFGEGPTACPFVALENDRDRRSDEPDHRHRCYAEPDPAPRALAHQREYCLAATFTACPIFQDWAIRAAATPVPLRLGRLADVERDPQPAWAAAPPWFVDEPEEAASRTDAAAVPEGFVAPPARDAHDERREPPEPAGEIERLPSLPREEGQSTGPAGPPLPPVPPRQPQSQARVRVEPASRPEPEPEPGQEDDTGAAAGAPPPFLAGRAAQRPEYVEPRRSGQQSPPPDRTLPSEKLRREDVVPPWAREPIYPLQTGSKVRLGGSGSWISRITTVLAIAVILSLAVAAVILAPSLLGDGGHPSRTAPVAGASPTARQPTPTPRPTPTPAPTPVTYTVQPGDTLFSIALRHALTVEQLLLANPQITNPDLVQIGQQIIIPEPNFGLFSPTPSRSPRSRP